MKPLFERMAITKNKFSPHEVSSLKINEPLGNFAHLPVFSNDLVVNLI